MNTDLLDEYRCARDILNQQIKLLQGDLTSGPDFLGGSGLTLAQFIARRDQIVALIAAIEAKQDQGAAGDARASLH